jgi:hypothetical protein
MAYTEKILMNAGEAVTIAASETLYYTSPASALCAIVKEMVLCNTSANVEKVSIFVRPSAPGDAASAGNTQFQQLTFQPNETKILGRTLVLPPGACITAYATTVGVVSLHMSGVVRT